MGKSTLLNCLARKIKNTRSNCWTMKVDLNDFTNEFSEAASNNFNQQAIEFLSGKIMKVKTNFEKDLFRGSCESTGNVVLLFDGFDEVANYYKAHVAQLIKSLLKTKIEKCFIASRPEWSDYLQKTFSQIKHALLPFGKEDQEQYLLNFMKESIEGADEEKLKGIVETILKLISIYINDKYYKFTGVPLITKLVGEFFESKISEYFRVSAEDFEVFIEKLEKETFDLIKLYDHFVEKKLQVYYEEKCKMIVSSPQISNVIKQGKQKILENYETLAVRQILKTDVEKHFPSIAAKKLDEDELKDLVKVGLIYEVKSQWKFAHQTYAEYGFNKFLDKNFDDENCAKFIVEVVLVDPSYQVIRTFMNFWILEKVNEKTCAVYQKILLESSIKGKKTLLHVACWEGNENCFCFLYSALAAKTENFETKKSKIENYLLEMTKHGYIALVYYFQYCHDDFNILPKIHSDFGVMFLKKLFKIKMDCKLKFLHAICRSDSENIFKVLIFLRENFSNDLKFLGKVFLTATNSNNSFLHFALWKSRNVTLTKLLGELNSWKELLGQDCLNELILMRSDNIGVFLSNYAFTRHFDNNCFISFLSQIKFLCDQETFKKFFFVDNEKSRTLLHHCCYWVKDFNLVQVLEWLARELGHEVLTELIMLGDHECRTIFHCFISSDNQSNSGLKVLSILRFLKKNLKFETIFLVDKVLFNNDKDGESLLSYLFYRNCEKEFFLSFLKFLENELNVTDESVRNYLLTKFLFRTLEIGEKQTRDEVFNSFDEKFGMIFFSRFDSNVTFHQIFEKHSYNIHEFLKYLNLIAEKRNLEFLKNYISRKLFFQILFYFHRDKSYLTEMLKWLGTTFKNDKKFLKIYMLQADENLDSFLIFALKECEFDWIVYFFTEIYGFLIKNLDKAFVKEFLLLQNIEEKNFLNIVCKRERDWCGHVTEVLDTLFKDFQNDQDFFTKLINKKSKKDCSVKEFMKYKLKINLLQEQAGRSNSCKIS